MLARDCSILQIGLNYDRLYAGADPDYELSLGLVRDRVNAWHKAESEKVQP